MQIEGKQDGSPVTEADLAADRIIADGLEQLAGDLPTLSEERTQLASPPFQGSFFLIDPLDGTKEFVAGRDEFTVNLALVTEGVPLLGIVSAPALGLLWRGIVGRGAERVDFNGATISTAKPIHTRKLPARGEPWIAAVSRSHGDPKSDVVAAAGGRVTDGKGGELRFGQRSDTGFIIPDFIAWGDPQAVGCY